MTVISDVAVSIPRRQRHDEAAIEQFRQQLINNHPDIKRLL
jgi:NitT/TauT family transport system ATP-binding protein